MGKIVTLGEIMLRLSPEGNYRFVQTDSFRIIPGGGEANVAVSLANYGHDTYFVSKLPKHEIGQIADRFHRDRLMEKLQCLIVFNAKTPAEPGAVAWESVLDFGTLSTQAFA